jgi:hypothetical protein
MCFFGLQIQIQESIESESGTVVCFHSEVLPVTFILPTTSICFVPSLDDNYRYRYCINLLNTALANSEALSLQDAAAPGTSPPGPAVAAPFKQVRRFSVMYRV